MKVVQTFGNGSTTYTVRVDYQDAEGDWFEHIVAGPFETREEAEGVVHGGDERGAALRDARQGLRDLLVARGRSIQVEPRSLFLCPLLGEPCRACGERMARVWWAPGDEFNVRADRGVIATVYDGGEPRCDLCCIRAQYRHACEASRQIPSLQHTLAELEHGPLIADLLDPLGLDAPTRESWRRQLLSRIASGWLCPDSQEEMRRQQSHLDPLALIKCERVGAVDDQPAGRSLTEYAALD